MLTTVASGLALAAAARAVDLFPVNGNVDYQLGDAYTPPSGTQIVNRDHTADPADGMYNICYINAFQTQPEDKDWWTSNHDSVLLRDGGDYYEDPDWEGEILLDTTTQAKRDEIAGVMKGYIDDCVAKGFNAVEADNLDTFTRTDLLKQDDNFALAKTLADYAHSHNLAFGQKNAAEFSEDAKAAVGFDFAVTEECQEWKECGDYTDVYGQYVIEIEYKKAQFDNACDARGDQLPIVYRDKNLKGPNSSAYKFEAC
ncbi:glycoside hydrolase family 114 protein [Schizophyllum fasciatum]